MKSLKPHAFIRISDGKVFIPHPTEPNRWMEQFMFEKFNQMGWDHWTTSLFMQFVAENSFYVAYDQAEMDMYSELCIANKTQAARDIEVFERKTGLCYYCQMHKHVCLCSHDD